MYILQVVSTVFWIWNGISFLFPMAFCQNAMVPTSFRKIGSIAETVSYAHLHLKIDLADILKIHRDALMNYFQNETQAAIVVFATYITSTIILATIMHYTVELPFIRMGKRITGKMRPYLKIQG